MVAFHDDQVRQVQDATDIVALVGEHVTLKPKGKEYVGLCPFHDDKNPSMCVVPNKQIFHCFVCNTSGNAFGWMQKFHRMAFREALQHLAERAGITLKPRDRKSADGQPRRRKEPRRETKAIRRSFGPTDKERLREEQDIKKLSLDEKLALLQSKYRTKV